MPNPVLLHKLPGGTKMVLPRRLPVLRVSSFTTATWVELTYSTVRENLLLQQKVKDMVAELILLLLDPEVVNSYLL